jgi:hypothetical protein
MCVNSLIRHRTALVLCQIKRATLIGSTEQRPTVPRHLMRGEPLLHEALSVVPPGSFVEQQIPPTPRCCQVSDFQVERQTTLNKHHIYR